MDRVFEEKVTVPGITCHAMPQLLEVLMTTNGDLEEVMPSAKDKDGRKAKTKNSFFTFLNSQFLNNQLFFCFSFCPKVSCRPVYLAICLCLQWRPNNPNYFQT